MRSGPWSVTVAVLVPLAPAGLVAWQPLNEGLGVLLLLAAVSVSCWIGGVAGGSAAAVLALLVDDLMLVPPRMAFSVTPRTAPHLLGFAIAVACIVAITGRIRAEQESTERARDEASALNRRIELIGPILDDVPIGIAMMDRDMRFRYANKQFAEYTGQSPEQHLGRTPADMFGADSGRVAEEIFGRVLATGEPERTIQVGRHRPDGERRYLTNGYPVRDSGGWVIGVGVGGVDLTEQLELEERYRHALAELTATIRSSPVAIGLLGPDLRFRQVNREFQALSGDPDRALVGCPLIAAKGLPARVVNLPGEVLRTGDSASAVDVPIGSRFVTVTCFPVRADDGELIAVALFILDVSEQHWLGKLEAEAEALRATAELAFKLERAQRLAGLGSWELDLATRQLSWSGETKEIVGDPERYFGGGGELPVHPEDTQRVNEFSRRLINDGVPFADEFRLVRPDGTIVDVSCTGEAIPDESGRPVRVWGTFQDVSAKRASERATKEARAQLEAEHQALQMFVRAMLPAALPEIAGAELAAAYLPVVERVDIGGDWFDSFRLPDGRLALAVGDVTGHDLRAATVMGQVRNAVRAYAYEDPSPGEVLRRTDLLLSRVPELDLTTMVYGVYDPATFGLTWANAGHPAPLLRRGRTVSELTDPGGVILGVFGGDVRYAEGTVRLAPGDTVLWFTDGLVDLRGTDPAAATLALMAVLAGSDAAPDRLLAEVTERMLTGGVQEDDVCLLALHRAT